MGGVVSSNPYVPIRHAYQIGGVRAVLGVLVARGKRLVGLGLR